ncbi:hypothetical protein BpHYR1_025410 [Brachionus plicatilis]|uniref:Uncharacterized protein n=1 Tax=Brachionus plicatilis TaxID=10195 RepID=A0A3M7Q8N9_BRAPC|nr:hypothetical protein BpHYR1_025410 [Brachionus plicatilis]
MICQRQHFCLKKLRLRSKLDIFIFNYSQNTLSLVKKKLNLEGVFGNKDLECQAIKYVSQCQTLEGKDLSREDIWVFWIVERFRELGILLKSYSIQFVGTELDFKYENACIFNLKLFFYLKHDGKS